MFGWFSFFNMAISVRKASNPSSSGSEQRSSLITGVIGFDLDELEKFRCLRRILDLLISLIAYTIVNQCLWVIISMPSEPLMLHHNYISIGYQMPSMLNYLNVLVLAYFLPSVSVAIVTVPNDPEPRPSWNVYWFNCRSPDSHSWVSLIDVVSTTWKLNDVRRDVGPRDLFGVMAFCLGGKVGDEEVVLMDTFGTVTMEGIIASNDQRLILDGLW